MRDRAQVPVPLRDLVVEYHAVAPDGGHKSAEQPVVLMAVVDPWSEDDVRTSDRSRVVLQDVLDRVPGVREPTVVEATVDDRWSHRRRLPEQRGRTPGLLLAVGCSREDGVAGGD